MRCLIITITTVFGLPFAGSANADDKLPSMDHIVSTLKIYYASLEDLDVEYLQDPNGDPAEGKVSNWRWMKSGSRRLFSLNSTPRGAAVIVPHCWNSFDGEQNYQVVVDVTNPKRIDRIDHKPWMNELYDALPSPPDFIGQRLMSTRVGLIDLLPMAKDVRYETISGHNCIRVILPLTPLRDGKTFREISVWLDPAEQYLPRRFYLAKEGMTEDEARADKQSNFIIWEAKEFVDVESGTTGEPIRFPKRFTLAGNGGECRYDFNVIRINHRPIPAEFIPDVTVEPKGFPVLVR